MRGPRRQRISVKNGRDGTIAFAAFHRGIAEHGLFLGFAAWNEREIDAGADIIGDVMRRWPAS
jgi:hypothetical protein